MKKEVGDWGTILFPKDESCNWEETKELAK